MLKGFTIAIFLHSLMLAAVSAASGEDYSGQLCLGFHPEKMSWGQVGVFPYNKSGLNSCPANHAMVASNRPHGEARKPQHVPVLGDCCPLPPDALTEEVVFAVEACPEGFVVTGAELAEPVAPCNSAEAACRRAWEAAETRLRCTKVNQRKYALGPALPGALVSLGYNFADLTQRHLTRLQIPISLRYAIGRFSRIGWTLESCIGQIPGSLLQGRTSKRCDTFIFRELHYLHPPQTPVPLFSRCRRIHDPLDPNTHCSVE